MKTVTKKIVRANTYAIPGPNNSSRKEKVTAERIKNWASIGTTMLKAGLRIPAPINHDFKALPVSIGNNGLTDAAKNQGFWTKLAAKPDEDGIMSLYGELEVPDNIADKVGSTIQETSIYVRPTWTDGLGRLWKDAPMHIALVNNPIEPNQSNFEEGSLALSMSMEANDTLEDQGSANSTTGSAEAQADPSSPLQNSACNIQELLSQLREVGRIDLPEDTLPDNLPERLLAALRQKRLSELEDDETEGTTRQPPKNSKEPSRPIVMSQTPATPVTPELTAEQANALVMAHPAYKHATETARNLLAHATNAARRSLQTRVSRLQKAGICTKEYADKYLVPHIANHSVAFNDDGSPIASPVEVILEGLEGMTPPAQTNPAMAMSHGKPTIGSNPFLMPGDFASVQKALAMSMGQNVNDLEIHNPPIQSHSFDDEAADKLADAIAGPVTMGVSWAD